MPPIARQRARCDHCRLHHPSRRALRLLKRRPVHLTIHQPPNSAIGHNPAHPSLFFSWRLFWRLLLGRMTSVMAAAEVGALAGGLTRRMRAPRGLWPRLFGRASPRPNHGKMFCKTAGDFLRVRIARGGDDRSCNDRSLLSTPPRVPPPTVVQLSVFDKIAGLFYCRSTIVFPLFAVLHSGLGAPGEITYANSKVETAN